MALIFWDPTLTGPETLAATIAALCFLCKYLLQISQAMPAGCHGNVKLVTVVCGALRENTQEICCSISIPPCVKTNPASEVILLIGTA